MIQKITFYNILLLLLLSNTQNLTAQCIDMQGPVAICQGDLNINYDPAVGYTLNASEVDEGSYDDCPDIILRLSTDLSASTPPADDFVLFPPGLPSSTQNVVLWVGDQAGNWNQCWVTVNLMSAADCTNDTTLPTPYCLNGLDFQYSNDTGATVWATDINAGSYDNCTVAADLEYRITLDLSATTPPTTESLYFPPGTTVLTHEVAMWVGDAAGNWDYCLVLIELDNSCTDDTTPPVAICDAALQLSMAPNQDFVLWAQDIDDGSYDECADNLIYRITDDLGGSTPPTTDNVTIPYSTTAASMYVVLWVGDGNGNWNQCIVEIFISKLKMYTGKIFLDDNDNCTLDADEMDFLEGWTVRYFNTTTGDEATATSEASGDYYLLYDAPAAGETAIIELQSPTGLGSSCQTIYLVDPAADAFVTQDFGTQLTSDCTQTTVDVGTPLLRRCFDNFYTVNYCNYSTIDAPNTTVTVVLHPFMTLMNSSIPATNNGNNTYTFDVGTLEAGSCDQIDLTVYLSCQAELGSTKCVEASISGNDCDEAGSNWSGASLIVTGDCDATEEKVNFTITNVGTNAMTEAVDFIVVEDIVMYMTSPVDLGPGESELIQLEANGSTWRVEVPQVEGHPSLDDFVAATVEGCTTINTPGLVNVYALPDADLDFSIDCQQVIGSFDPNDKRGYPAGAGETHAILANTDIEYKIRFQNTGTDTAFTVRIEDRISEHLDINSIQAGASSHPYRFEMSEDNDIAFIFDDIMLPDSNVNEPMSHGFVKFKIKQLLDNPIGTEIENTAAIYFDFNEAVWTNTTLHTIDEVVFEVNATDILVPGVSLDVAPNPFMHTAKITLEGLEMANNGELFLYNQVGQRVRTINFTGNVIELNRDNLQAGIYFFQIQVDKQLIAKII